MPKSLQTFCDVRRKARGLPEWRADHSASGRSVSLQGDERKPTTPASSSGVVVSSQPHQLLADSGTVSSFFAALRRARCRRSYELPASLAISGLGLAVSA